MSVPIVKEYNHSKSLYYLPLMVKAKTKTSLSILPTKRKKFQNCIDQTDKCFAFYRKTKLNYQRVKYTNGNQNCYEELT